MGKKISILIAMLLSLHVLWPAQPTYAASITRFSVHGAGSYLIAGKEYVPLAESDKAWSTAVQHVKYEYSPDNGATWRDLPIAMDPATGIGFFRLPIDPQLTSAQLRVSAYFSPLIGSKSYSEKTIGPYTVLQPADPTDFVAVSNEDGTVTLKWTDQSNMESHYRITRHGPDGTKTFRVNDTAGHIGPLQYADNGTNRQKSTIYVYSLTPVIDGYDMPDELQPGTVNVVAKTKASGPAIGNAFDLGRLHSDIAQLRISPDTPALKLDDSLRYLESFRLTAADLVKVGASGVRLNPKSVTLEAGASVSLTAAVTPSDAANKKVVWTSDDPRIAEVDDTGKVTAKSPGTAQIKAKTEDGGFADVCLVTVIANADKPYVDPKIVAVPVQWPDPRAIDDIVGKRRHDPVPGGGGQSGDSPGETGSGTGTKSDPPASTGFPDTEDHWGRAEIASAVQDGIVDGYPDGTFRPNANVTRAEFATMLMKGLKPSAEGMPLAFADKDAIGDWAVRPVAQAVRLGIVSGYEDGTVRPNANITRAEMITMVMRASGLALGERRETGYSDDADIPDWARLAVSTAQETGIIIVGGLPEDRFAPQTPSIRAEAAAAIVRMLEVRGMSGAKAE
ncbi:S-layer homology domain-containing protein [Paenibacillus flagellatus]|uniref:SLH domain-containing protein n=1 Tax=Paenibacillus flagellatus TaxID=2211139 RepID=A0A2V5K3F9_9BACL|nr:S-layer homology domain-containing protein [Paenibacillus flagellatus]PYI52153.1 hypothetical protein DLM86_22000 [Paenibacillus flagellatus]